MLSRRDGGADTRNKSKQQTLTRSLSPGLRLSPCSHPTGGGQSRGGNFANAPESVQGTTELRMRMLGSHGQCV
eukprot:COSAG01_NODE_2962_length_6786_cov_21.580544_7_plen_73_part_00